jgi:hypothetical protein
VRPLELTTDQAVMASSGMLVAAVVGQIHAVASSVSEYDRRIAALFASLYRWIRISSPVEKKRGA